MEVEYTIEATEKSSRLTLVHEVVMPYWVISKVIELLVV